MKRILFFIISMMPISGFAQTLVYQPIVEEGKVWTVNCTPVWPEKKPSYYSNYALKGDTVIGEYTYKRLFKDDTCIGAMRENNKRVYFYDDEENREIIQYDFNLGIDGKQDFKDDSDWLLGTIDSHIDTIEYVGIPRRTLYLYTVDSNATDDTPAYIRNGTAWIEGIGNNHFPIWYDYYEGEEGTTLLLHSQR